MPKTRIEHTTNTIVHVVSAKDDGHCLEIRELANQLGERYRFVILTENESFDNFDRKAYPSCLVLCPKFLKDKTHYNWSKTKFDLYYDNHARRESRTLLADATPLKTRQMLELFLVFAEIKEAEDMTYRKGGRAKESHDSKDESKYFTSRRVNVTVHQMCRLLEVIEAALDEEDIEKVRKIMEQWEDHILTGCGKGENMKRLEVVRVRNRDEPKIDLSLLEDIGSVDTEQFEPAKAHQWEQYLKRIKVEIGKVVLVGFNNGDVDVIRGRTGQWVYAVDALREWLDQVPSGGNYEIYWKFSGGTVRKYSEDY